MSGDLINQLRDIHYPADVSIWPLAIGWYFLILIFLLALFLGLYWISGLFKKHSLKKIVLRRLDELQIEQLHLDVSQELSILLKRAALAAYPRRQVAGLCGEQWLQFLDKTAATTEFTAGRGRLLITCPYEGGERQLPPALFHLIRNWVKKNL
jgi:Domain of unknown function (DUF4381)